MAPKSITSPPPSPRASFINDCPKSPKKPPLVPSQKITQLEGPSSVVCQSTRLANVALPFLSLYKPFSYPLSIATGSVRTLFSIEQLVRESSDVSTIPLNVANACISTLAVAGTVFAHPVGMLLTTGHDCFYEVVSLARHVQKGNNQEAFDSCTTLVNNALYLTAILAASPQAFMAFFATQAVTALYRSISEFKKGNYLEGSGHALMGMIRSYQLAPHVNTLYTQYQEQNKEVQTALPVSPKPNERVEPTTNRVNTPPHTNSTAAVAPALNLSNSPFEVISGRAQYKGSDYSNALRIDRGISLEQAQAIAKADDRIDYFVYNQFGVSLEIPEGVPVDQPDPLGLISQWYGSYSRDFGDGDAVFFKKEGMWLGTAPCADTYVKRR